MHSDRSSLSWDSQDTLAWREYSSISSHAARQTRSAFVERHIVIEIKIRK
jgi:hypothetical protein